MRSLTWITALIFGLALVCPGTLPAVGAGPGLRQG
jgi:hypothetical protein